MSCLHSDICIGDHLHIYLFSIISDDLKIFQDNPRYDTLRLEDIPQIFLVNPGATKLTHIVPSVTMSNLIGGQ